MRAWIFLLLVVSGLVTEAWLWFGKEEVTSVPETFENTTSVVPKEEMVEATPPVPLVPAILPKPIIRDVEYTVPFTSQAPTGDWSKSVFQDGCEEASTLMVWIARTGKKLTREEVKAKLLDMAEFQTKLIGHGVDTDASDTNEYLLKQYFEITDGKVEYDVTLDELKAAIMTGLVIVPTNGRALGNPNFTAPGPLQHMLVITGYDAVAQVFSTNDPGTRMGAGYRYPEQALYDAIREYPTGKHLSITTDRKAMIVVPFEAGVSPRTNAPADF